MRVSICQSLVVESDRLMIKPKNRKSRQSRENLSPLCLLFCLFWKPGNLTGVEGFEPPTDDLEGRYSIHLSYTPNIKLFYLMRRSIFNIISKEFFSVIAKHRGRGQLIVLKKATGRFLCRFPSGRWLCYDQWCFKQNCKPY